LRAIFIATIQRAHKRISKLTHKITRHLRWICLVTAPRFIEKKGQRFKICKGEVMRKRSKRGQSMVEYAIGIGAVTAVCMLALGGLGHASADVVRQVLLNINDKDDQVNDPGSIFVNLQANGANAPWNPQ
jgi:hypothetical protein